MHTSDAHAIVCFETSRRAQRYPPHRKNKCLIADIIGYSRSIRSGDLRFYVIDTTNSRWICQMSRANSNRAIAAGEACRFSFFMPVFIR